MSKIFLLIFIFFTWHPYNSEARKNTNFSYSPCECGSMKIEQFQWQPSAVPSPGYVYYTMKATISDSETARCLARGDLQMTIELLSPSYGIIPMPCSHGVGSCIKPLAEYAPDIARLLSEGQTTVVIDNKAICIFDAAIMGDLYASGQYRITATFLEADTHKTISCHRFETYVIHGQSPCPCVGKENADGTKNFFLQF